MYTELIEKLHYVMKDSIEITQILQILIISNDHMTNLIPDTVINDISFSLPAIYILLRCKAE